MSNCEIKTESINSIKTTINFFPDLKLDSYWKQWTGADVFVCVKITKSGLVQLLDPNGKHISVPKRNCNALLQKNEL